jgi:carbon-monoxide dehydrogenase small subunit
MIARKGLYELVLSVNGEARAAPAKPQDTLLRHLRERLGLTGAKLGCENGDCGACTVLVDGSPVKSCMMLAVEASGHEITTIEGLGDDALRDAFLAENGYQCGYCTSGVMLAAHALLSAHPRPSAEEKREWMEPNLCRCTGYEGISKAIDVAAAAGIRDK